MAIDHRPSFKGMRRIDAAALGVVLAAAGAATPALAQGGPATSISLSAEARHDSNVIRGNTGPGALRSDSTADQRLNVGVALDISRPLGRNTVALNGFVGYDFYRKNTRLNRERISLAATGVVSAGPCELTLSPKFNRQQSNLYELAVLPIAGIDSVRNAETTQIYRGEARCGGALGIRPLAYYQRSYGDNSNPLREISDYRGEMYGGGLSYSNPVLGSFDLSFDRSKTKYPRRSPIVGATGYREDSLRIAASRDIGAILTADGFIGYTWLKPNEGSIGRFRGLSWTVGLTAVPITDLRIRADLSQTIQPSLGNNDALYSRNRSWGLSAEYQLGPRTSFSVSGSRNDKSYRGRTTNPLFALSDDRIQRVSGRFNFRPGDRLSFGIEGGYEHREANETFYDYSNTYVALTTRFSLGT